ncbi:MAG: glycosyltransferase family 2 protein [Paludibacteraceae bacterium]|nr:glycosyltransferase family 2 protein [Paludibacteraceae bacterium]
MVSVIIPIYNSKQYLRECLDSVVKQDFSDLEILLIDDGSTDGSYEIASEYARSDSRIVLKSQGHHGQSAARNLGLDIARGEYISFVDADDYINHDFISTLVREIKDNDIVQCGYKRITNNGKIIKQATAHCKYNFTSMWCRLIKKQFIDTNHIRFIEGQVYEDVMMSVEIWERNPKIRLIDYMGYYYRLNPRSTTSTKRNTTLLYDFLWTKIKNTKNIRISFVALYTLLRLHLHFLLNR